MLLRKGSTIVLQMHYTTNGKEALDRTKVGLFFARQAPAEEVRFANLSNGSFTIPAGAADHVVTAEMVTTADVTLRQMLPHTHLRGKSWEYTATYPDGRSEVLLAGAEVRLQLADLLRLRDAGEAAQGHEDSRRGALRQLGGEQGESGSAESTSSGAIRPGKR